MLSSEALHNTSEHIVEQDIGAGTSILTLNPKPKPSTLDPYPKQDTSEYINVKIKGQDESVLSFKIRPTSELKKVMETYCTLQNLQIDKVLFNFGTSRVNSSQTPGNLKMKDRDIMVASWFSEAKLQAAEVQVQGQEQEQGTMPRSAKSEEVCGPLFCRPLL